MPRIAAAPQNEWRSFNGGGRPRELTIFQLVDVERRDGSVGNGRMAGSFAWTENSRAGIRRWRLHMPGPVPPPGSWDVADTSVVMDLPATPTHYDGWIERTAQERMDNHNPAPGTGIDLIHDYDGSGDSRHRPGYGDYYFGWDANYEFHQPTLRFWRPSRTPGARRDGGTHPLPEPLNPWQPSQFVQPVPDGTMVDVEFIYPTDPAHTHGSPAESWSWGDTTLTRWRYHAPQVAAAPVAAPAVAPTEPVERAFTCPLSNTTCTNAGCTVMHCEAHKAALMARAPKKPKKRNQPTGGVWEVDGEYVFTSLPNGDSYGIAFTGENEDYCVFPPDEDQRRANALRISLIPRMETLLRQLTAYSGYTPPGVSGTAILDGRSRFTSTTELFALLRLLGVGEGT